MLDTFLVDQHKIPGAFITDKWYKSLIKYQLYHQYWKISTDQFQIREDNLGLALNYLQFLSPVL